MLKEQVKTKNPMTGRVADQLKKALLTSPSDANLVAALMSGHYLPHLPRNVEQLSGGVRKKPAGAAAQPNYS